VFLRGKKYFFYFQINTVKNWCRLHVGFKLMFTSISTATITTTCQGLITWLSSRLPNVISVNFTIILQEPFAPIFLLSHNRISCQGSARYFEVYADSLKVTNQCLGPGLPYSTKSQRYWSNTPYTQLRMNPFKPGISNTQHTATARQTLVTFKVK